MHSFIQVSWTSPHVEIIRLAVGLLLAGLAGEVVSRFVRLPRITGYALAGLALGPALLGWFRPEDSSAYRLIVDLTLTLLLFELGVRVDVRWLRTNPWILASSLVEALLTFAGTYTVLNFLGAQPGLAATLAAIAIGTSPAVVMRVATELQASGQVTQRLFVHTALNVMYSIVVLQLIVGGMHGVFRNDWTAAVLHPLYLLIGSLAMGLLIAGGFLLIRRLADLREEQAAAILFGLLLLAIGFMGALALPALLAPLIAGILVNRLDRRPHLWPRHFGSAGGLLVIMFFVFMGVSIDASALATGVGAAMALIVVRFTCKSLAIALLGPRSGLSVRQSVALGLGLLPVSGVALLLTEEVRALYPDFGAQVSAVIVSTIALLELAGPLCVQWVLKLSHETNERGRHGA